MVKDELKERRARRKGKVTVSALAQNLMNAIELGRVEAFVFVVREPDGTINVGVSDIVHTEAIGMIELAKHDIIQDMYEPV